MNENLKYSYKFGETNEALPHLLGSKIHSYTGVKLDGKSIWKIHMDFFFENPFFLNLF